ncbi:extended synaptotagmin-2-like isoform X4 [Amphibalanus amphitrite]|uniref:extended synaptotagmin-2-like isoform X4 n=1 Tax=Amphibalanus amphitrite TaxID=1232801 RepID=UPI001C929A40|nr:extended synaptotagmin-2-like isoform X4 [Amphibalanus amphitrite]
MSDADGGAAGGSGSLGMLFLRRTAAILGIYAVGYLELSPAWLVGGIILSVMREKWSRQKKTKRELARAIALNSEQVTLAKLQDLPSWVHFPDVERAEWLNKMLKQMWPYVGDYVKNLLKTQFEASLAATMSGYKLYNFKFEKIYLGDIPPRVGGVKVYSDNVQRSEIIMDLEIFYAGDSRIECSFSRMTAGIKDFQLHGVMRIVYKPLISSIPIIGGMQLFFLNNPDIDFNMLGVADVLDMPGLSGILRNVIVDTIAAMMVLPNKWPIILSDQVPTKMVTASQPKGVLRLRLIEGKDLMKKDRNIFGQGKSDPYAIIYIGAKQFKTKYIQDTVDPVWNYVCETDCLERDGIQLRLELWDWDASSLAKDDFLGRCGLDVADIAKAGSQDLWVPLEQARSGRIHLKLDWLSLSTNVADIKKQLNEIEDLSAFDHSGLHSAVLTVFVDSAKKLPMASRAVEPDPLVRLVLGNQKEATSCKYRTLDPVWEEGFSFLVKNPLTQTMTLEVEDQSSGKSLGSMQLELKSLLREADLSVTEQPHTLYNSGPQSKVVLSIQLRILTHDKVAPEDLEGKIPSAMPLRPVAPAPPPAAKPDTDAASGKTADPAQPTAVPDPTPAVPKPAAKTDDVPPSPPSPVKKETKKRESKVEPVPAETREEVETLLQDLSTDSPVTETSGLRQRKPENPAGADRLGRIQLTLRYSTTRGRLVITVHKVANLPMQGDDIPDPYVKTYLLPDRSEKNKRKTKKLTDNCDPVFEETFEYKGPLSESQLRTLEVLVVSKKTFARNPVIGMKHIDLRGVDLEAGTTEWFDLEPEERFESSHPKYDPYSSPAPPPAAPPVPEPEVKQETPYPAPAGSGKTAQESESAEPVPVAAPLVEPPPAASTQPAKPPQHLGGADKLGRIQLTLKYNQARCALAVVVHKVTNLPMQGDDIPDPYVKTYLLPDRSEKNKRKTQKFKDNCNPVYEETLEYEGKLHELLRTLEVQVVSKKTFAPNPILGMKHIDLKSFDLENGMTLWFDLEPEDRFDESEAKPSTPAYDPYSRPPAAAAPPPVAEQPKQKPVTPQESAVQSLIQDLLPEDIPLREDPPGQAAAPSQSPPHPAGADRLGRIELTLRYSHMKDALEVTVHRVANLPVQGDDIPDPYVKTYLLPDKSGSNKRKTEKFKDECNPVYEETFEYKGKQSDVGSRTLEVQVVSKKTFGWNPVLGMKHIDLRGVNLEAGTTDWFDLEPEERFDS